MLNKKTWEEFRNTGLFLFINSILHAFGWAIVLEVADDGSVSSVYPARVKFRGFPPESVSKSYERIGEYLKENSAEMAEESAVEEPSQLPNRFVAKTSDSAHVTQGMLGRYSASLGY
jgi:hypothetical protein